MDGGSVGDLGREGETGVHAELPEMAFQMVGVVAGWERGREVPASGSTGSTSSVLLAPPCLSLLLSHAPGCWLLLPSAFGAL